jgi:hypothetical protein
MQLNWSSIDWLSSNLPIAGSTGDYMFKMKLQEYLIANLNIVNKLT